MVSELCIRDSVCVHTSRIVFCVEHRTGGRLLFPPDERPNCSATLPNPTSPRKHLCLHSYAPSNGPLGHLAVPMIPPCLDYCPTGYDPNRYLCHRCDEQCRSRTEDSSLLCRWSAPQRSSRADLSAGERIRGKPCFPLSSAQH